MKKKHHLAGSQRGYGSMWQACPGRGCPKRVPLNVLACDECLDLLPSPLREEAARAYIQWLDRVASAKKSPVLVAALHWYNGQLAPKRAQQPLDRTAAVA